MHISVLYCGVENIVSCVFVCKHVIQCARQGRGKFETKACLLARGLIGLIPCGNMVSDPPPLPISDHSGQLF